MSRFIFLVGSPRSGTTLLETLLGRHSCIADWYEPYFVWERYLSSRECDAWAESDLTERARGSIRDEYERYAVWAHRPIVIDKTPTHVFNIRLLRRTFPEARWIHLIRDGRDVTLSISKEWARRRAIVEQRNPRALLRTARDMLERQRFWRYRAMALWHEVSSMPGLDPRGFFNKSRWRGQVGWGPRFPGWQESLRTLSTLEFNALQWRRSVEAGRAAWPALAEDRRLEVRYERLLATPGETMDGILRFLGLDMEPAIGVGLATLDRANHGKWAAELAPGEIAAIRSILAPTLEDLGYARAGEW